MNVFSLSALLTLDDSEYDKKLGDAAKKGEGFGSKLKHAAGVGIKAIGAGIAAGATAVTTLTTSATKAYADYEQLVGGVETLFGAGGKSLQEYAKEIGTTVSGAEDAYGKLMTAQNEVMRNAQEAYKTAGLSTNDYLETVTSFSAALIGSLEGDTVAAANLADQAIRDMSDNANKMGTDMELIQNAYNGFAKGNFTMLDNLKLGFGGTKEEMQRLLDTAHELTGVDYDIDSYADIVNAINAVQTEMGITGTTAKEAASTISGSVGMMKGAWQNFVAGLGDSNADMDKLMGDLVDSAETAFENILPVAEKALDGIATAIEKLAPVIAEKLPGLVARIAPSLITVGSQLLLSLASAITENLPILLPAAFDAIRTIGEGILANLPMILESGLQMILTLAQGLIDALPELIPTIVDVVLQIVDMLTQPDTLSALIDASIAIMMALANGLIEALPRLLEKAPEIVGNLMTAIVQNAPKLLKSSWELMQTLGRGIVQNLGLMLQKGGEIVQKVVSGIGQSIKGLWNAGLDIVKGIWQGISDGFGWIKERISGWVGDLLGFFKRLLKIGSPSKVFADQIGKFMAQGVGVGFVNEMGKVEGLMEDAIPDVGALVGPVDIDVKARGRNDDLLGLLRDIRDNMGYDIVMEDGTLVGWMDKALGRRAMQRARGNA